MGKIEGKGLRGLKYLLTQKKVVAALRPRESRLGPETLGSPECPGKTRSIQPSSVSTQKVNPVNVLVQSCLSWILFVN
jgi:hypothetical protein